jgi:ABC-type transport system involved in multi-copper enzyme maturation permease subunit
MITLALVLLRFRLLLRQKIGWVSLLVGLALILIGYSTASVSFVSPQKIFWDFALGLSFVLVHVLALYLGAQLFNDEKERRTLHLVLVGGVSRPQWLVGNILGIWLGLVAIDSIWFVTTWLVSLASFSWAGAWILIQVKILQALSVLVVLAFTSLFSLLLRPLLALFLSGALFLFLYSVSSVERVFSDPQTGMLNEARWALSVLKVSRFLPPLEWFDLKMFVGYESQIAWSTFGYTVALGCAWTAILLGLASWRFQKLDL